jgi:hypothetical protein
MAAENEKNYRKDHQTCGDFNSPPPFSCHELAFIDLEPDKGWNFYW